MGRSKSAGFTLIELLVVIAIIAILAAILFPVFAGAKRAAKSAACQSNLSQLGKAMHMYMDDWFGKISDMSRPGVWGYDNQGKTTRGWSELLFKYHRKLEIYQCPMRTVNFAYSMNENMEGISTPKRPARCIAIFECPGSGHPTFPVSPVINNWYGGGRELRYLTGDSDQSNGNVGRGGQEEGEVYGKNPTLNPNDSIENYAFSYKDAGYAALNPWEAKKYYGFLFFPGPHNGAANILFWDGHVKGFTDWNSSQMTFLP